MKSSFTNRTHNFLLRYYHNVVDTLCTLTTYTLCLIQDAHLGKGCSFMGVPKFSIGNGGGIFIGRQCKFISTTTGNHIGLNHKCLLSATPVSENEGCILSIGNGCGFSGVSIWCFKQITIGNNVRVGANCLIMDGDAHFEDPRTSPAKPIVIEDNVFIGANCVIRKGVTIGENAVIGMNSVVTKDIPANCVAVGSPCKVIRQNG